jgi:tRNA pseudouridine38-40 synthase
LPRIALIVAYSGRKFHGWQSQSEQIATIQRDLTRAVSTVADSSVVLHSAGRTDTGVHASKQVVHFDSPHVRPDKAWVLGVNAHLGDEISVEWSGMVADDFDARHSATARRYLYLIYNNSVRSALMPGYLTQEHRHLNESGMHDAAQALLGENDFSSFRAASCQSRTPMRYVSEVNVLRRQDLVMIDITANAFLHHMVRNIAGVLMDVGAGNRSVSWVGELLSLRDRTRGGVTAAPEGLYLIDVHYPDECGIPADARLPHFLQIAGA